MDREQLLGSQTAKNGFQNEYDIVDKFNNWILDEDAQKWLLIMQYDLKAIEYVKAIKLSGSFKTDVQVQVTIKLKEAIDAQNLQVKLVSNKRGFNQIDKRWVDKYAELWNMPINVILLMKKYTGEIEPDSTNTKDKRRMYLTEFSESDQSILVKWFNKSKSLIVADILKGRGQFAVEWMLVAQKIKTNSRWILKPINYCLNHYGNGNVEITKKGNLKVARLSMQRKGGDRGRNSANMLQFKLNPAELFESE